MNEKHTHEWTIKDSKEVCETCGKTRLVLQRTSPNLLVGKKSNGKVYTVRAHRERIFSPDEWKLFLGELKDKYVLTFEMLMLTGARIDELHHIKKEDIDFANQRLTLKKTKHKKTDIRKSHTRMIRICSTLTKTLERKLRDKPRDFQLFKCFDKECAYCKDLIRTTKDNMLLSTATANKVLKRTAEIANIKEFELLSVHSIRKTAETWALALGVDVMLLSKRFGHNLMTMYMHYSQSDAYSYKEKSLIKEIYGDTFI